MKLKFSLADIPGELSRNEMKKITGGDDPDDSFGGDCTKVGQFCDLFTHCGDPYCSCTASMCLRHVPGTPYTP